MGEKVAFIGLGAMGGPMALNIIKKGTSTKIKLLSINGKINEN